MIDSMASGDEELLKTRKSEIRCWCSNLLAGEYKKKKIPEKDLVGGGLGGLIYSPGRIGKDQELRVVCTCMLFFVRTLKKV